MSILATKIDDNIPPVKYPRILYRFPLFYLIQDECSAIGGADSGDNGDKEGKKKKNRCLSCKKKVGLTGEIHR